jgi:hypothetical protein
MGSRGINMKIAAMVGIVAIALVSCFATLGAPTATQQGIPRPDTLVIDSLGTTSNAIGLLTGAAARIYQQHQRAVSIGFVVPALNNNASTDSIRVQVKILGGGWWNLESPPGTQVVSNDSAGFGITVFPFDSIRVVADTTQTAPRYIVIRIF